MGVAVAADDRTPVLVGCGQLTRREPRLADDGGPLPLMAEAARAAAADAGPAAALLQGLEAIVAIRLFSDTSPRFASPFGRVADPPRWLAAQLGATAVRRHVYTHPGGNMPQWCLNRLAEAVARGEIGSALVCGAEALATHKAAERAGLSLDWSHGAGSLRSEPPEAWGDARRGWSEVEDRHGARAAIAMYPMFEAALRHRRGRSPADHQQAIGDLLARFAAVAASNPLADRRAGWDGAAIATASADNPWIAHPYTRRMCANAFIDQGAALILTSVARARALGVPRDRWVFLHGCADAHDHWHVSQRRDFHSAPAMAAVFAQALAMAGRSLADMRLLDVYSCFASAVQVACEALGLAEDDARGLTVTGGLPYFGGPGNNYVTHAIAEMMQRLRGAPGAFGLVTANGNYLTKHSAGIYCTERPEHSFAPQDPAMLQARLDAEVAQPAFTALAEGPCTVETCTVLHGPSRGTADQPVVGQPVAGLVFGRLDDGSRFIANTAPDADLWAAMQREDFIGRRARVGHDGQRNRVEFG